MNLRTVLITLAVVLLVTSIIGASASDDDQAVKPPESTTAQRGRDLVADPTARGTLPRDKVVRAQVGQLVTLTVQSPLFDSVTVAATGETEAVSPGAPAEFSFVADRPGSFPVSLDSSGRRLGRVVVTAAREKATPARRPATPGASGGAPAPVS